MRNAPKDLDAGFVAHSAGRPVQARRLYEQVLAREPENCRALFLLGFLNAEAKESGRAIELFERCVRLQPALSIAHNALGNAWMAVGDVGAAAAAYRGAIDCPEPCVEAFCNLGSILRKQGLVDEAISLYRRALALKPGFAEAWCNLGVALKELNRLDEAADAYRQALRIKPDMADAHFNEGLLLLLRGDLRAGWQKHEYRWDSEQRASRRQFAQPLWLGASSLAGKTILIHAEQGLGDTLQFVRYLSLVEERGARIILEVQPALKTLVAQRSRAREVFARGEALPRFDVHCPLLSLPLAFGTELQSIPNRGPYLFSPEPQRSTWRELLGASPGPRIGFVWFGNRHHKNDGNRSIPAAAAERFLSDSPVALHCLQVGISAPEDAAVAASPNMVRLTERIADFSDTAALVEQLDLVIAVDTSVAHLAGGMGKPLWVLLPFAPDWRWLLGRGDSPWYPSARLFRQPAPRDWDSVLLSVRGALKEFCRNWKPPA